MKNTTMSLLIVALSLIGLARALSFYEVGDTNGWTTKMQGLDYYNTWSSSMTFYVKDSFISHYNKDLHNVMEVSFKDYELCNPNSPLATYQSEYEPVKVNRTGHYYFICGVPGHCESGQKFEVVVMPPATAQQNNSSTSSNPKPNPTNDATIASLPHTAASDPCVWSGLGMLSFILLQTLVFL
ncbi:hypothetical protein N665_1425s0004 [Sinapis alba]|nr:hypothetical protein N665_1425s0004 [Sinapis alba]